MRKFIYSLFIIMLIALCKQNHSVQLALPPRIYCGQLSEISLYYENLIQVSNPGDYSFKITPELGIINSKKYTFDIQEKVSRNFSLSIDVFNKSGRKVSSGSTVVCYTAPGNIPVDTVSVLITGNSLAAAGIFPAIAPSATSAAKSPTTSNQSIWASPATRPTFL